MDPRRRGLELEPDVELEAGDEPEEEREEGDEYDDGDNESDGDFIDEANAAPTIRAPAAVDTTADYFNQDERDEADFIGNDDDDDKGPGVRREIK
jgi:hypothetical protein